MARLRVRRGSRSQLDTAAGSSALLEGEPVLITDETKLAVATSTGEYVTFFPTVQMTAAEYAALGSKDPNVLYMIVG